jgi:hypothetical protein
MASAPPAFVISLIGPHRIRHVLLHGNSLATINNLLRGFFIQFNTLGINTVIILANRIIKRPVGANA